MLKFGAFTPFQNRLFSVCLFAPLAIWMIVYGGVPFMFLIAFCYAVSCYEWARLSQKIPRKLLWRAPGFLYITISFIACFMLREAYTLKTAILFIVMVWSSDIGAYLIGKKIKGPKMAPIISPNKTWSGFAAALLCPGLTGLALFYIFDLLAGPGASLDLTLKFSLHFLLAGALLGFVCQAGDLLMSLAKRRAGVKDTGAIIPGHGGLLDRIDSMMPAALFFLYVAKHYPHVFQG